MAFQTGPKAAQRKRLADLNDAVLIKFKSRETFQTQLLTTTDPVLIDALQERILLLRNAIIEEVIKDVPDLLEAIAYSWNNSFSYDEARSYILENLMEATERYKTTKVPFCKFTSFFWMYNKNLLRNRLKTSRAAKRDRRKTFSLDAIISPREDDNDNQRRYDMFSSGEDFVEDLAIASLLKSLYSNATTKQKRVLKRLYLGYSQSDIARALGVTGTNINTVIKRLRKELIDKA